ncbi:MAG: PocR ligand-binding domain-containing protein, partial [Blastocatellia bacterium]|nr:PocR ligand-binding domain-containing protein [Blastocatellia bacterium]
MIASKPTKKRFLDRVAEKYGVAIAVLDESSNEKALANNNSICAALYNSQDFGHRCAEYCGAAFAATRNTDAVFEYECHAGLTCKAIAVQDAGAPYVAIVGRSFIGSDKYREATTKAIDGEWRRFRPTEFFANILISGSSAILDGPIARLRRFVGEPAKDQILELPQEATTGIKPGASPTQEQFKSSGRDSEIDEMIERFRVRRASPAASEKPYAAGVLPATVRPIASLLGMSLVEACSHVVAEIASRHDVESVMWLERRADGFAPVAARGDFAGREVLIRIDPSSDLVQSALRENRPIRMVERGRDASESRLLKLFPVGVGSKIGGAIAFAKVPESQELDNAVLEVAASIGPQLEILRLRSEVAERDWLAGAVKRFSENLKRIDTEDFWTHLTQISAELLQAERASLLIQNEGSNELYAKAAIGVRTDLFHTPN